MRQQVLVRRYIIPGGSAGHFQRDGYVLDVGASMMFGMGDVRSSRPCTDRPALRGCMALLLLRWQQCTLHPDCALLPLQLQH